MKTNLLLWLLAVPVFLTGSCSEEHANRNRAILRVNEEQIQAKKVSDHREEHYDFPNILPLGFRNGYVHVGKPLQFDVYTGTSDSSEQLVIGCEHALLIGTQGERTILVVKTDKPGEQLITGTVTVLDKSGFPKRIPWIKQLFAVG